MREVKKNGPFVRIPLPLVAGESRYMKPYVEEDNLLRWAV